MRRSLVARGRHAGGRRPRRDVTVNLRTIGTIRCACVETTRRRCSRSAASIPAHLRFPPSSTSGLPGRSRKLAPKPPQCCCRLAPAKDRRSLRSAHSRYGVRNRRAWALQLEPHSERWRGCANTAFARIRNVERLESIDDVARACTEWEHPPIDLPNDGHRRIVIKVDSLGPASATRCSARTPRWARATSGRR